jgi:competence protein ComEC
MGWGISLIEAVAHLTAQLPDAVLAIPAMPIWGLVTVALGGLWLAIWRTEWRWLGTGPVVIGLASILVTRPPDLIVSADGRLSAIRQGAAYLLSTPTADKSDAEEWARAAGGFARAPMPKPGSAAGPIRCDHLGCRWLSAAGAVAIDNSAAAVSEDCLDARLLITRWPASRACRRRALVLDGADLRRAGVTAIWIDSTITMRTANAVRGDRPWVAKEARDLDRPTSMPGRTVNTGGEAPPADPGP